jgi:mxaJ protein
MAARQDAFRGALVNRRVLTLLAAALCLAASALAAEPAPPPQALRVCADPDNLPYSHEDGSGFENRIAQLLADDLKLPLQYEWLPDRRGFVRKTLGARLCDVIIGVPVGFERAATTQAYYRSSYVFVQRAADAPPVRSFDDPRLARMRLGVQLIGSDLAASPPGYALARHGYTSNVRGYPLAGDEPAAARMVAAVASGELDGALLWGPQAGFFASRARVPLRVAVLPQPPELKALPFEYSIAMGVRRGDPQLRELLDDFIRRRQGDIHQILAQYAVPRTAGGQP